MRARAHRHRRTPGIGGRRPRSPVDAPVAHGSSISEFGVRSSEAASGSTSRSSPQHRGVHRSLASPGELQVVHRLLAQIERLLAKTASTIITGEVVEATAARRALSPSKQHATSPSKSLDASAETLQRRARLPESLCIEHTFDTMVGMRVDLAAHDVKSLDLDELESGICSFAARLAAATAIFLVAVGEYDRRRGWETWECRNMVHWLTWKCGTSPVTAREQVRVSDALGRLPLVREHSAGASCPTRRSGPSPGWPPRPPNRISWTWPTT